MVKYKIVWSLEARLDLIDILDFYLKENGTAVYSRKLNARINKGIHLASKNPFLGTPTDNDSIRTLAIGDYQIIYEIPDHFIFIIMVWDCRQDPDKRIIDQRKKS